MIYVDVTGACLLPLQSGIPRTTRGVYQLLVEQKSKEIRPLFWQPFRGCYTDLSIRAQALLRDPFSVIASSKKTPRDSTLPLLWASFSDLLGPWPQVVPLNKFMGPQDTFFITSIFPDNRLEYLQRLMSHPGQKIAIFHDAIPLRDSNVAGWEKSRHVKTLRLLSQMSLVIAVSRAAENDLRELWRQYEIAPAPIRVIPWPVPFTETRPDFSEPPWERKRILYVSRLKQVKNHATLFAACEKLWRSGIDFTLELIGCEDEAKESRTIRQQVQRLQNENRPIVWRGHVSEEELHEAYHDATFTVFPSLTEGFGLPIVESFWHGRVVICSGDDAMGELARDGGCLTTEVRNTDALAEAMRSLLEDREKCLALSKEAYLRPLRSWADYGRELNEVLDQS